MNTPEKKLAWFWPLFMWAGLFAYFIAWCGFTGWVIQYAQGPHEGAWSGMAFGALVVGALLGLVFAIMCVHASDEAWSD